MEDDKIIILNNKKNRIKTVKKQFEPDGFWFYTEEIPEKEFTYTKRVIEDPKEVEDYLLRFTKIDWSENHKKNDDIYWYPFM